MERAENECILCGVTSRLPLIEQGPWRVHRCASCGLGVLDPRPDGEELKALYRQSYFDGHFGHGPEPGTSAMKRRLSQEEHRLRFFRRFNRKGRLLDMGCGMGYFPYACRLAGYDAQGFDLSGYSTAYAREVLGIPVTVSTVEHASLDQGAFDIVTMWHFLEHSPDPQACLRLARHCLKPGGLLVADVPNHEGTDARRMGDSWPQWDLPYHLYHFTPQTLLALLDRHGFHPLATKNYHSETVKERLRKIPGLALLARPIAKFFSGHSIAVVARKI